MVALRSSDRSRCGVGVDIGSGGMIKTGHPASEQVIMPWLVWSQVVLYKLLGLWFRRLRVSAAIETMGMDSMLIGGPAFMLAYNNRRHKKVRAKDIVKQMLEVPEGVRLLRRFLVSKFSDDLLDFYLAQEAYSRNPENKPALNAILKKWFYPGATHEMNLPQVLKDAVLAKR